MKINEKEGIMCIDNERLYGC